MNIKTTEQIFLKHYNSRDFNKKWVSFDDLIELIQKTEVKDLRKELLYLLIKSKDKELSKGDSLTEKGEKDRR